MGYIDNLNDDDMRDLFRRVRQLETASPLGNSSVMRGQLRIGGTGTLLVDGDGGAVVQGSLDVTGTLNGDGTITWTGTMNVDGPLEVDGDTALRGPVAIEGDVGLTGDMTVEAGGSVTVAGGAPVRLGIADNGFPGLQFPAGALTAADSSIQMQAGNAAVGATSGQASMVVGSVGMGVNSLGTSILGRLNVDTSETTTGVAPNCFIGTDGRVRRIV